ncbi:MAG TPA: bifunctional DNA-binding transcriptional regulator/O6-methylguanine-DNA methyltransferase Ada [Geobacteraceae bacterium]|nr:bifunctional DNA-binding transcriptional regulator/O6-methylguanine-DNA methyltransferase Ada [Geobacteraceae bacterium]
MFSNHNGKNEDPVRLSRWQALLRRERPAREEFVYGVTTTGVYCLPDCPSRLPNPRNVRFFDNCDQAEKAGFRPCKRCMPASPDRRNPRLRLIVEACKSIEESEYPLSLKQLADAAGLSVFYFQRLFKMTVGITPRQYHREKQMERMRDLLSAGTPVTEALYNAGFASSSRFYENATEALGMRASRYRKGGQGMPIRYATAISYLGWVLVAATGKGVCAIDIGDDPETLRGRLLARFPRAELQENDPDFGKLVTQVIALLESPRSRADLPLDIQGTAFQRRVWMALRDIPAGTTATYTEIAERIGKPKAARAVAKACASNAIAVAIPCHRVLRGDGTLAGYRWGIERKRTLLDMEAENTDAGDV